MATQNTIDKALPFGVSDGGTGATTFTNHGVLVGSGTSAITALTPGTAGQVLIGSTGSNPVFASITSTGNTVLFTPGDNSLNIETAAISILWTTVATATSLVNNNGYISNKSDDFLEFTLPVTAGLGATIAIVGKGAGKYQIYQNASQSITIGSTTTTAGVTGYLEADSRYNCLEMVCRTANTEWVVRKAVGTFTAKTYSPTPPVPTDWTSRTPYYGTGYDVSDCWYGSDGNYVQTSSTVNGGAAVTSNPTSTWTLTGASTNAMWNSVCYNGTHWVIAGSAYNSQGKSYGGAIAYATDPYGTWTKVKVAPGEGVGYKMSWNGTAYGNGSWAVIGHYTDSQGGNYPSEIWTATTPSGTWVQETSPWAYNLDRKPTCLVYGGSYFVTGTSSGYIATATDATSTWTDRGNSVFSTTAINAVATDGTYFVMVGDSGKIRYATDPTGSWSTPSSFPYDSTYALKDVSYHGDVWIVIADDSSHNVHVATATDPTGTWTDQTVPALTYSKVTCAGNDISLIFSTNGYATGVSE